MSESMHPVLLLILDGWGYSEDTRYNPIAKANVPVWNRLWESCPHTLLSASGMDVGLPNGQMGNSEVGHTNLGAGRVVYQDLTRISKEISDGSFEANPVLGDALASARASGGRVHILGLLSDGGVHSHLDHIIAMVRWAHAAQSGEVLVHAFLDGRDTPPRSASGYLHTLQQKCVDLPRFRVASLCGRYFAMDRDRNGQRMQPAWDLLMEGIAPYTAADALSGVAQAYARGESDEFVQATAVRSTPDQVSHIQDGDVVIFMNFRADRARQLMRSLLGMDVPGLQRSRLPRLTSLVQLTSYAEDIKAPVAFPGQDLNNVLGSWLAQHGLQQLRIAETEKYAHVTFFFNGGQEQPFAHEERILIASPKVATFDLKPEMSVYEITDRLVEAMTDQRFAVIVCNFANGDQVGHTGIMPAAIAAVEAVDRSLERVIEAAKAAGIQVLITADHGNVECLYDEATGQALTAHTTNPVPLVYVGPVQLGFRKGGVLADVAPTMLDLLGLDQPAEMTGHSLIERPS